MNRRTQQEEKEYQQGRRDAIKGRPEQNDSAFYLDGWRAGKLEAMQQHNTSK